MLKFLVGGWILYKFSFHGVECWTQIPDTHILLFGGNFETDKTLVTTVFLFQLIHHPMVDTGYIFWIGVKTWRDKKWMKINRHENLLTDRINYISNTGWQHGIIDMKTSIWCFKVAEENSTYTSLSANKLEDNLFVLI